MQFPKAETNLTPETTIKKALVELNTVQLFWIDHCVRLMSVEIIPTQFINPVAMNRLKSFTIFLYG